VPYNDPSLWGTTGKLVEKLPRLIPVRDRETVTTAMNRVWRLCFNVARCWEEAVYEQAP